MRLFEKRLVLISGKGGVGRTAVSAALAVAAAKAGKRVLLTEITLDDQNHSPLARAFGHDMLPAIVSPFAEGIAATQLLPLRGMELFITSVLKVGSLARAAAGSSALRRLVDAAPSFREMGLFFHLLTLMRETLPDGRRAHDVIVSDMPATGHTLALTALPEVLGKVFPRGPVKTALDEGKAYLYDPAHTAAWAVALPEPMVVTETLELVRGLAAHRVPVGGVVLNKVRNDPFSPDERAALAAFLPSTPVLGAHALGQLDGAQVARGRLKAGGIDSVHELPLLESEGPALIGELAQALGGAA